VPAGIFVPTFPQCSPPWILSTAACGGLGSRDYRPSCTIEQVKEQLLLRGVSPDQFARALMQKPKLLEHDDDVNSKGDA